MKVATAFEMGRLLVVLDGSPCVLYGDPTFYAPGNGTKYKHGFVTEGSTELTLNEAKQLRNSLDEAIRKYEEIDKG
jgi:hypothetical protein